MQTTTVYVVHLGPGLARTQAEVRDKLDQWINAISTDDIKAELAQFYKDCNEEQIAEWFQGTEIQGSQSKEVVRAVMGSMRIKARTIQTTKMITRAHQRLMMKSAHRDDLDLSINI